MKKCFTIVGLFTLIIAVNAYAVDNEIIFGYEDARISLDNNSELKYIEQTTRGLSEWERLWKMVDTSIESYHLEQVRIVTEESIVSQYHINDYRYVNNLVGCDFLSENKQIPEHVDKMELELSCLFQDIDNFVEERQSFERGVAGFERVWVVKTKAGSKTQSKLQIIDEIPYYVYSVNIGGDCGWHRIYETFHDNNQIQFFVRGEENGPCNLHPSYVTDKERMQLENEVDVYFDSLNVQISSESSDLYSDLSTTHPNHTAISYISSHSIVSGYPDGTFRPSSPINRAEFTKIIVGATTEDHSTIKGSNCFPDVEDEWFAKYVCTAKDKNIIGGYPDGTFKPADNVNFAEAAKIVVEAFELIDEGGKEDGKKGEAWYGQYVLALQNVNAIPLSIDSLDKKITRGEMAEMIYRLHAGVEDLPSGELL